MKLIDLLREHLTEWPHETCKAIAQDGRGGVFYWRKTPEFDDNADSWTHRDGVVDALLVIDNYFLRNGEGELFETCEDYYNTIITREMFEAPIMKELTATVPTGDLIDWRNRIIEIQEQQHKLQLELRGLHGHISALGFKLDLSAMKK